MTQHNTKRTGPYQWRQAVVILLWIPCILAVLFLFFPYLSGRSVYTVMSESMEPEIKKGSLIYVQPVKEKQLTPGDIITFHSQPGSALTVTHRMIAQDSKGQKIITKGDHNKVRDAKEVPYSQIVGRVTGKIPYIGTFLLKMRSKMGFFCYFGLLILWVILDHGRLIYNIIKTDKKSQKICAKSQFSIENKSV